MPLVLNGSVTESCECKLYFRDSRYSEYAMISQYTKILNV